MFADFVLVLKELVELDPDMLIFMDGDEVNIYSKHHGLVDPSKLSKEALLAMVSHGWRFAKDDEDSNYYFEL